MKNKSNKSSLIVVIAVIVILVAAFTVKKLTSLTKQSATGQIGNSASNLYNYGLFCDDGERIFFANPNDQGMLYSMDYELEDIKLVTKDVARYINADDNYIYYSRMNNLKDKATRSIFIFYSNGLFRIGKNGKHTHMLWNEPIGSLVCYDNKLYYQYYLENEKLAIHKMNIDGSEDISVISDEGIAVCAQNNNIYYSGLRYDRDLHSVDINSNSSRTVLEGNYYQPVVIEDIVYYIAADEGYKLKSCSLKGENRKTLVGVRCSTFNISPDNRYIYYQVDNSSQNGFYRYEIASGESICITPGNYKWLNTVQDMCFFYDFESSACYCYKVNVGLISFAPPKLSGD